MTEEQYPNPEEIKARLRADIPVEEEGMEDLKQGQTQGEGDVVEALRNLGEQLARTVKAAWESPQRQEIEQEIRRGMKELATEVDKAFKELKESPAGQRVREEAVEVKSTIESGEAAWRARNSLASGLQWLSTELSKLADQFQPAEKQPEDVGTTDSSEG